MRSATNTLVWIDFEKGNGTGGKSIYGEFGELVCAMCACGFYNSD